MDIAGLNCGLKSVIRTFMLVRAKKESIKRSGRSKKTIHVTRMISMALPTPSIPPCRSQVRLMHGKRTWKPNQKKPVFIGRDFLTVP